MDAIERDFAELQKHTRIVMRALIAQATEQKPDIQAWPPEKK